MKSVTVFKVLVFFGNLCLLCLGGVLMYLGIIMSSDTEFVNFGWLIPLKYPMPLTYYAMFGVTILGVVLLATSIVGYFAIFTSRRILLALQVFLIAVLLLIEMAVLISITTNRENYGLKLDNEEMTDSWQRYYAIPGKEYYTNAIDLIQTKNKCCGVQNWSDWKTSWWKLREYAPEDFRVPLSCCLNSPEANYWISYLDPEPQNITACQNEDIDIYQEFRHTQGCRDQLEFWLETILLYGLEMSSLVILCQIFVLLFSICLSFHMYPNKK